MNDDAGDLFTTEQKDYVAGLGDDLLRGVLLHRIRAINLMTEDRDRALQHVYRLEKDVSYLLKQLEIANAKGGFDQEPSFMSGTK